MICINPLLQYAYEVLSPLLYHLLSSSAGNALRKMLHLYAKGNELNEREYAACKKKKVRDCFATAREPHSKLGVFKHLLFPLDVSEYGSLLSPLTSLLYPFLFSLSKISLYAICVME